MKIEYTKTPRNVVEFDEDVPANLNPTDIVEIFQTPLTGSFNWDYTGQDNRIKKLYELGNQLNWNVEEDVDWKPEFTGINDEEFEWEDGQWENHKVYKTFDKETRIEFFKDLNSWATSQFLHGEQGALLVASQLASCAPTYNAKLYASSQTFDEARHVEAFNKYLQQRLKRSWPIGRALKGLLDKILTDPRWDLKFIGMQVVIEGLALAAFNAAKESTNDPVFKRMLELIIRDEARHVTFGIKYLTDFVTTLTEEEKLDYTLSNCCNPLPGEKVFGFLTVNEGIKVHRTDCKNAVSLRSNFSYRILAAKWIDSTQHEFRTTIQIIGIDNVGVLNKITTIISNSLNINMLKMSFDTEGDTFKGKITLKVSNKNILDKLINRLKKIHGVDKVVRF